MYYIGQTRTTFAKRDWSHRKDNNTSSWFDNCYRKHPDQFSSKILVTVEAPTKKLLVETLNELEIAFIAQYKSYNRKLYNFLNGGNAGWVDKTPTVNMLKALDEGRTNANAERKANARTPEEKRIAHRAACKNYELTHPDKYKQNYTKQNRKGAARKREWYLKNRERILAKMHSQTQKGQREVALLNSEINAFLP